MTTIGFGFYTFEAEKNWHHLPNPMANQFENPNSYKEQHPHLLLKKTLVDQKDMVRYHATCYHSVKDLTLTHRDFYQRQDYGRKHVE